MPGPGSTMHPNTAMQTHLPPARKNPPGHHGLAAMLEPIIQKARMDSPYDVALQVIAALAQANALRDG